MRKADLVFAALMIITVLFVGCVSTASAETHDGKIISAKAEPDLLVSGQPMSFVITVKNTGTVETDFDLDINSPLSDFPGDEFSLNAGDTKTLSINSWFDSHHHLHTYYPGGPGPKTYTYMLYWDKPWPASNILLDTVVEERRCFSTEEVSDNDKDNLLYYVEVEQMGTDPDNPDTDGDGKQDDIDKRPTIPEGTISLSSSPSGAKIYLDGVYKGTTPLSLEDVISESHTVRIVKEWYYEETKAVSLGAGGTIILDIQLKQFVGPTEVPTAEPIARPRAIPTVAPTAKPTAEPTVAPIPPPVARPTPRPTSTPIPIPVATPTPPPVLSIPQEYLYAIPIALFLILLPFIFYIRGKRKKPTTTPKTPPEQKPIIKKETPPPISEPITIERAIYDPCKRDFIEGRLPRMKEWINRYDPGAYWFAISIQNNTDRAIEEWGVELETSSALKVEKAIIEGMEYKIELRETHPELYKNVYAIGVPKEYGIVIPKGGAQRVYFKLHTEKPKTTYEISGIFKSPITGDVPVRAKEFKYLCDTGVSPEAVKAELKKTFSEKDAARLANTFRVAQEIMSSYCNTDTTAKEINKEFDLLKMYFTEKEFLDEVENVQRRINAELREDERLDEKHVEEVKDFCEKFTEMWIARFLR